MRQILLFFMLFPCLNYGQSSLIANVDKLIAGKQFQQAEKVLLEALPENTNNIEILERIGDVYGHQKKWEKAAKYYKKLRDLKPEVAEYHYKYGGVLGMKALQNKLKAIGLVGDIKSSFTRAAELDENHIEARWALVELYMQLPGIIGGSKKKSLKYAEQLQELSPVDGYLAKGYIYEYDNEPEKAEYYYKEAIRVGGSVTCYQKLTDLYTEKMNKPSEAIGTIEEAYQKHKRNALHYQIGKVSSDYKIELDKGIQCLKRYIENYKISDGVPLEWAYYRMAKIYRHKRDAVSATTWIDKALKKRKNFKEALKEKALIEKL
ncbi:tetratricopeptide repeat protein [Flavobacteriaceae bacterium M23B6Z8]